MPCTRYSLVPWFLLATLAIFVLADGRATLADEMDHWSLKPVQAVVPPAVENDWGRGPVDAFVLRRLDDEGLGPSADAEPGTLIRRVYLDMLGLPPTPGEIEEFARAIRDTDIDQAYDRLVDRVLASPRYGERWAQHWLDVVRFAESSGSEINQWSMTSWPYRDYVIRAFNADRSYDQFIFEQLAGDQCEEDAATGFLVAGPYDRVVNQDPKFKALQRQDELDEIVKANSATFLGMTIECARCHDHRFDPFTQRDYYAMQAIFSGVRYKERRLRGEENDRWQGQLPELDARMTPLREQLETLRTREELRPAIDLDETEERFEPVETTSLRFTIEATHDAGTAHLDELEVWSAGDASVNVALSENGSTVTSSGHARGGGGKHHDYVIDGKRKWDNFWRADKLGPAWLQIDFPRPMEIDRIVWATRFLKAVPADYRAEVLQGGEWIVVSHSRDRMLNVYDKRNAEDVVLEGVVSDNVRYMTKLTHELGEMQREYDRLEIGPQAFVGKFEEPLVTQVLDRGDPGQPLEKISPAIPVVFGSIRSLESQEKPPSSADRRIAFARWLGAPTHPLTARVMVNRIWQHHFGTGIVDTPSDFGTMGARPTHPELLDWLASDFVQSGWSIKHVHRRILRSSTFRQASTPRTDAIQIDGDSRLLWRFPPRRLAAEVVRDSILSTSGTLDLRMYGPGFSFFKRHAGHEKNTFADAIPREQTDSASWRRMIYGTKIRQESVAVFGEFDCPDAGQMAPKRSRSTTPLQALGMLNSPFISEQVKHCSRRVKGHGDTTRQMLRVFSIVLGRQPSPQESFRLTQLARLQGVEQVCRVLWNTNEFLFLQ